MTKKLFLAAFAAASMLALVLSCSKGGTNPETPALKPSAEISIHATLAKLQTKVSFEASYGADFKPSAMALTWADGDKLRVYNHADHSQYSDFELDAASIGDKDGVFNGTAVSATSWDVEIINGAVDYGTQTQPGDGETGNLKYLASASGVTDLSTLAFTDFSSVLAISASMPDGVAEKIKSIDITASEAIFATGNTLTITFDSLSDAEGDKVLHFFATLPQGNTAVPAGTTLLIHFNAPGEEHDVYTRFVELEAQTFTANKLNTINVNAVNSDKVANGSATNIGTASNPYLIGDKYQMQAVNGLMVDEETKFFKLIDDLDMTGVTWTYLNSGSGYKKLIDFDGNNKTISNLGRSLFYVFKGSIKNLTLDNSTVTQRGILAEYIQETGHEITNVTVNNGTLSSGAEKVGGLIGIINKGSTGVTSVTIENCKVLNTGITVSNSKGNVGGLIGFIDAKTMITGCSVSKNNTETYTVSGADNNVGGLIGNINAVAEVSNCSVSDINVTGPGTVGGVIGYSNAQGVNISGCSYSGGTVTATSSSWCGGFVGSTGDYSATISDCHVTNATVTSSSDRVGGFVGQIGRNGVTVKGCSVGTDLQKVAVHSSLSGANVNMGGFVGVCYGTVTKNGDVRSMAYTTITSGNSDASKYVNIGGFVGYLEKGSIDYCDAVATMSGIKGHQVGGFAAVLTSSGVCTVDNCTANATVSGNNYVAGFIGQAAAANHVVSNNTSAGTISGAATVAGFVGLAAQGTWTKNSTSCTVTASGANSGNFAGQLNGNVTVSQCFCTGSITGNGNVCGGFTGIASNGATINDCYSTCTLGGGTRKRGGIAGYVDAGTVSINRCYTTCDISNNFEMGGLVGFVNVETFTMTKCAAWNGTIVASSRGAANWSSAACVGVAYLTCTLTDNYRNPNMDSLVYWGTNSGCTLNLPNSFQHPDVSASAPLTDINGNNVTHANNRPYQGKCDASKTLSQLASATLGWSGEVWDFSQDLPRLKWAL